jgi:hypothetical protein
MATKKERHARKQQGHSGFAVDDVARAERFHKNPRTESLRPGCPERLLELHVGGRPILVNARSLTSRRRHTILTGR